MATINGETITGIALSFLAILFIYAGLVNEVWAKLLLADYFILAMGIAFIVLGVYSIRKHRTSSVKEFNTNSSFMRNQRQFNISRSFMRNQRQFNISRSFMRNQRQFNISRSFMRNQRRIGEAIMIASGLGLALGASMLGITFLAYGGLAISGLGIVSALWR
jgi:putative Ca2+/H+ antiporter (TMEM165/GDT1 family)